MIVNRITAGIKIAASFLAAAAVVTGAVASYKLLFDGNEKSTHEKGMLLVVMELSACATFGFGIMAAEAGKLQRTERQLEQRANSQPNP